MHNTRDSYLATTVCRAHAGVIPYIHTRSYRSIDATNQYNAIHCCRRVLRSCNVVFVAFCMQSENHRCNFRLLHTGAGTSGWLAAHSKPLPVITITKLLNRRASRGDCHRRARLNLTYHSQRHQDNSRTRKLMTGNCGRNSPSVSLNFILRAVPQPNRPAGRLNFNLSP